MSEKISAESIPGQGTTFSFTIVAETIPGKQLDLEKADKGTVSEGLSGQKSLCILVAEDTLPTRSSRVNAETHGLRPDDVADGREVIQALEYAKITT